LRFQFPSWLGNLTDYMDWDFMSVPQKHGSDKLRYFNRGKTTGGTSGSIQPLNALHLF
jgi:hypothetical protein